MSRNINMENNMQEVDATMNSAEKNNNVEAETMANEINKNEEGKVMEASFKETADTIMDNAFGYRRNYPGRRKGRFRKKTFEEHCASYCCGNY